APDGVAPDSLAALEERLRAALPFDRRIAAALAPPPAPPSVSAALDAAPRPTDATERAGAALPELAPPPPAPVADAVPAQRSHRRAARGASGAAARASKTPRAASGSQRCAPQTTTGASRATPRELLPTPARPTAGQPAGACLAGRLSSPPDGRAASSATGGR